MPKTKTYLKPKKENLLIKKSRKKSEPETADEIMAGMKQGDVRVGGTNPRGKPNFVQEPDNLDAEGIARRRAITSLLTSVIMPNSLSSKSTPEMDKRSLINKLNKSTFEQLKGLVPDRIKRMSTEKLQGIVGGTEEILDEEKVEIQDLYMETSP